MSPSSLARQELETYTAIAPTAVAALRALGKAVEESGLEKTLTELIKVRASQVNGCAFCVQYHLNLARKAGVAPEKLDLVAVWHDAGIYTDRERAALAWTETLTGVAQQGAPDAAFVAVQDQFPENELAFLTAAISHINAWNRIAIAYRFSPPIPKTGATA
jgi:AhpD family alkylhydroperoxidase